METESSIEGKIQRLISIAESLPYANEEWEDETASQLKPK
jgi:hypothetical protein